MLFFYAIILLHRRFIMLTPRKNKFCDLSLSELSFIVLNDEYAPLVRDVAREEIERRFSKNGCGFEPFIEREYEAISKRGKDLSNYLITPQPNGQLLMETYFKYVNASERENLHGDLLFSEVVLCNDSGPSFVKRAFVEEIIKIKSEIDRINRERLYGIEDQDNEAIAKRLNLLESIFRVLKKRVSMNEKRFTGTDIFRTMEDITIGPNSYCTSISARAISFWTGRTPWAWSASARATTTPATRAAISTASPCSRAF